MKILLKVLILALSVFTINLSAQTIDGGGGVISISSGANPNNISGLDIQLPAQGEAIVAHDSHLGILWIYDDSNNTGSKWEVLMLPTTVDYIASTRTLIVNGETQILPFANGTDSGLLGGVSDGDNGVDIAVDINGVITSELDVNELTTENTPDGSTDYVPIYDGVGHKKALIQDIQDGNGIYSGSGALSENTTVTGTGNLAIFNTGSFNLVPNGQVSISSGGAGNNTTLQSANDLNIASSNGGLLNLGSTSGTVAETITVGSDANDVVRIQGIDYTGSTNGDVYVVTDISTGTVGLAAASSFGGSSTDDQALTVIDDGGQIKLRLEDGNDVNINKTGDITVTVIGGELFIGITDSSLAYDNHVDAGAAGVVLGQYFTASTTNTMGLVAGVRIKRVY